MNLATIRLCDRMFLVNPFRSLLHILHYSLMLSENLETFGKELGFCFQKIENNFVPETKGSLYSPV